MIERTAVQSSNVRAIGYDHKTEVLHVEFPGGVYAYGEEGGVPEAVYDGLMSAPSIGSYFAREVRPFFTGRLLSAEELEGDPETDEDEA